MLHAGISNVEVPIRVSLPLAPVMFQASGFEKAYLGGVREIKRLDSHGLGRGKGEQFKKKKIVKASPKLGSITVSCPVYGNDHGVE